MSLRVGDWSLDSFVSEGWAGSSENTMKLHPIDGLTQVGYAKQRPTVLVGAVCDYFDSLFMSIPYLSSFFPSPPTWNCRKSVETLPHRTVKLQHTLLETVDLVKMPWNFWHWSISDIDHRQFGACYTCSRCGTFLFAPLLAIVLRPQYREKIVQHMLRAKAILHFPICEANNCPPHLLRLQQGRVTISSLLHTTSPFKCPCHGRAVNNVSWNLSVQFNKKHHQTLCRL